jgi:hypothetical protein
MLYPSDYFDECNGLIPQIALCAMLLEAGNEKGKANKSILAKDVSDSAVWSLDSSGSDDIGYLSLSGYLPLMESRYLVNTQNLVDRLNAVNSFNVALISDAVGLPHSGFDTAQLEGVILPSGIPHLSTDELVVEKRLGYLLLKLQKRNNLYSLFNYLRWIYLNCLIIPITQWNYTGTYGGDGNVYGSVDYETSIYGNKSMFLKVINLAIDLLLSIYPYLENIIFSGTSDNETDRLAHISGWLQSQLQLSELPWIPTIDYESLISSISDSVTTAKAYTMPTNLIPLVFSSSSDYADSQVSDGSEGSNDANLDSPPAFNNNQSDDADPLEGETSRSYSILNSDRPINTLPEC